MSADTTPGLEAELDSAFSLAQAALLQCPDRASVRAIMQTLRTRVDAARRAAAPAQGPTDEEIEAMVDAYNWDSYIRQRNARRNFARAVLARWGAPAASGEPVARKPLTHDEAQRICNEVFGWSDLSTMRLVLAVEAAHGIKP